MEGTVSLVKGNNVSCVWEGGCIPCCTITNMNKE